MSHLTQAILLGLLGGYCHFDWWIGCPYLNRPIILAPLAGAIMGDFQTGLYLGAILESYFLGNVVIGGYQAPDAGVSSILATAFTISAGLDTNAALLLAVPIAVITTSLQDILWALYSFSSKIADKYAEEGNDKGVYLVMFLEGIGNILLKFLIVFLAWMYGSETVVALVNKIPEPIMNGMANAGGVLPAIGMAILISMIMNKNNAPYFFLGFILVAFFNMPTIGIAVLGMIIIYLRFDLGSIAQSLRTGDVATAVAGAEEDEDDF
ncbi:MAG TPA: PTS sugar transporter subunit IIC [Erysipelotrichaceae bacterium]|nr:PTS sugar transporter subunit IIC [Erysipelotrichia bacterium]HPX32484.1 PTS sugar transporter subunit IIC [Erysipelotrichaceae bacterium]HQA85181.1 PTS sugar transporter subunit IIC [Erysipelotrichaceae bacterium]